MILTLAEQFTGKKDYSKLPSWMKKKLILAVMDEVKLTPEHISVRLKGKYHADIVRALLIDSPETNDSRLDEILNAIIPYGISVDVQVQVKLEKK